MNNSLRTSIPARDIAEARILQAVIDAARDLTAAIVFDERNAEDVREALAGGQVPTQIHRSTTVEDHAALVATVRLAMLGADDQRASQIATIVAGPRSVSIELV